MENQAAKEDTGLETGPGKSTNIDTNPPVEISDFKLRKRLLGVNRDAEEPVKKKLREAGSSGSDCLTHIESGTQIKQGASEGSAQIDNDALTEHANLETGPGKSTDLSLSKSIDSNPPAELTKLKLPKRLPVVSTGQEEPNKKKMKVEENSENSETVLKSGDEGSSQLDNLAQDKITGGEQVSDVKKEADGKNVPKSSSDGSSLPDILVQDNTTQISSLQSGSGHMLYKLQTELSAATSSTASGFAKMAPRTLESLRSLEKCNAAAARILQLKREVYNDWSNCLDADESGNLILHKAVITQDFVNVERQCMVIYARKQTLDISNNMQMTPLHLAAIQGDPEITTVLMKFGAHPGLKDGAGNNALHLAIFYGNIECLKAIVNSSQVALPLDDYNHDGYAALHLCALEGKLEEAKILISKGAKVDLKDARSGRTPLFHAVESLNQELMTLLLASGAKVTETNFSGQTPLSAAHELSMTGPDIFPDELSIVRSIANLYARECGQ